MAQIKPLAEHHPSLDIRRLAKWREHRVGVSWRWDVGGDLGGGQFLVTDREIEGRFQIGDHPPQEMELDVHSTRTAFDTTRSWFVCKECDATIGVVYWRHSKWGCRLCHGLAYLSQYITSDDRLREEYYKLRVELKSGRPAYVRTAVWNAKWARMRALEQQLAGKPPHSTRNDLDRRRLKTAYVPLVA